jgi:hypothetical protein
MRRGFQSRNSSCRDTQGKILSDRKAILERWNQYFKEFYGKDKDKEEEREEDQERLMEVTEEERNLTTEELESRTPTTEKVKQTINKLKNNGAPGPDTINAELLKEGYIVLTENKYYNGKVLEDIPQEGKEGLIFPIFKKGDQLDCSKYRGITAYKIFYNLLYERLQQYTEEILGTHQCGFRAEMSTSDQIHALRQILGQTREYSVSTFRLFIDFKAACDSIKRNKLFEAMEYFQMPKKLINLNLTESV